MRERVSDKSLSDDLADQRQGDEHEPAAPVGRLKTLSRDVSDEQQTRDGRETGPGQDGRGRKRAAKMFQAKHVAAVEDGRGECERVAEDMFKGQAQTDA